MTLKYADQFTIIQSYQKDDLYRSKLRSKIKTFFSHLLPPNKILRLTNELNLVADFLYFCLTTISTRQTIGQEYCNLILYDDIQRNVPKKSKRIVLIAIKIILPYILFKFKFEYFFKNISNFKLYSFVFDLFKMAYYYLNNFNTIKFFLHNNWNFFKLENYFTNIKYLKITNFPNETSASRVKMHLLALSLFLPLIYNILVDANKIKFYLNNVLFNKKSHDDDISNTICDEHPVSTNKPNIIVSIKSNRKCLLCLDFVKNSTLTTCGHCFCWYCINDYATKTSYFDKNVNKTVVKCPICRDLFQINKLVFLFNY
jgi:peroxin-10